MATSRSHAWSSLWIYAFALGLGVGEPRVGSAASVRRASEVLSRAESCRALASALASALRDPVLRGRLWVALESSTAPEHKLHLARFLEGAGRSLREAMQGASPHELSALLARAGNLELYLPVPAHRSTWRGGGELAVATALDDRQGPWYAVALDGAPVALSREAPPAQPVLALVPSESFRGDGTAFVDLSSGDSATAARALTGLWATEIELEDWTRYEGWLWGQPELELHVQDAVSRELVACVEGTRSISPRRLELAGGAAQRPVLLGTTTELPAGSAFLIAVVENDGVPCQLETERDIERAVVSALGATHGGARAVFETRARAEIVAYAPAERGAAAMVRDLGGDEVVGLVAGRVAIGRAPQVLFIKDELAASAGTVVLQHKTETLY